MGWDGCSGGHWQHRRGGASADMAEASTEAISFPFFVNRGEENKLPKVMLRVQRGGMAVSKPSKPGGRPGRGGRNRDRPPLQNYRQAAPSLFQFLERFMETHLPHNAPALQREGRGSRSENPFTETRNKTQKEKGRRGGKKSWQREVR